ncbi:helix-turn-helix domain-containing protein [Acidithiobacillus caldus]
MSGTERDSLALLYRRIAQVTQSVLATRIGISNSQMSRIVAGESGITLDRLPLLLDGLNLQLIETQQNNLITTTEEEYAALLCMAERGINSLKHRVAERV